MYIWVSVWWKTPVRSSRWDFIIMNRCIESYENLYMSVGVMKDYKLRNLWDSWVHLKKKVKNIENKEVVY